MLPTPAHTHAHARAFRCTNSRKNSSVFVRAEKTSSARREKCRCWPNYTPHPEPCCLVTSGDWFLGVPTLLFSLSLKEYTEWGGYSNKIRKHHYIERFTSA